MKGLRRLILLIFVFVAFCYASKPISNVAFAATKSRGAILFSSTREGNELTVVTTLEKNSGISSFLLSLEYDENVMTLIEATPGNAISGITVTQDLSVKPFTIAWDNENAKNSTAVGKLYTYKFLIDDNAQNGSYKITYSFNSGNGIYYYEKGNPEPVNALISVETLVVNIDNGNISVEVEKIKGQNNNVVLIVSIIAGVVVLGGVAFIIIKNRKNKKGWKKI